MLKLEVDYEDWFVINMSHIFLCHAFINIQSSISRHILYLLQTMHSDIKEDDMHELISLLEKLASTSQGQFNLIDELDLGNNDILPAVALTELPIVR